MDGRRVEVDYICYKNGDETALYDYIVESKINGFICVHNKNINKYVYINSDEIERIFILEKEKHL